MKKILLFSGSNSSRSINQRLILHISKLINGFTVKVLNLANFNIPIFSEDLEREKGYSKELKKLHDEIISADGLVISVPEHNGNLPAFFKNILDWLSRLDRNFLKDKKIFLCSTSPGSRGGKRSMEVAERTFPYFGGKVVSSFSLPSFQKNFSNDIADPNLKNELLEQIELFLNSL